MIAPFLASEKLWSMSLYSMASLIKMPSKSQLSTEAASMAEEEKLHLHLQC